MVKVSTRPRLDQSAAFVTGHQMAKFLRSVSSMEPSSLRTRQVVSSSLSTSVRALFGHLLFARKSLKPQTTCLWRALGTRSFHFIPFKVESRLSLLATRRILASTHALSPSSQKVTTWSCLAATERSPSGTERVFFLVLLAKWKTGSGQLQSTQQTEQSSLEETTGRFSSITFI